jgi:hypothetical protein
MPVRRSPSSLRSVEENGYSFDRENTDQLLWGVSGGVPVLENSSLELYALGLHERDGDVPSRNRRLMTTGGRWYRSPAPASGDFEVEGALQFGRSRASAAADDVDDLRHRAFFIHTEVGRSIPSSLSARVALQHDYVSGDLSPEGKRNNRFDTLFGARRFEWGPTGIYGPFARANLNSPGIRVNIKPTAALSSFLAYRLYWLASRRDAWTTSGLRDPSGTSGSFLGQQLDWRLRWEVLPKNLRLELGAAYLARGGFSRATSGSESPVVFGYAALEATL